MNAIENVYSLLAQKKYTIGIIMHQKPDGDAMGSTLGLSQFLQLQGHTTIVVSPTNWASYLSWMNGAQDVMDYEKNKNKTEAALQNVELLFCLDFNHFGRTRRMEQFLTDLKCTKILIDHHREPQTEAFDYGVSDINKSSTCEMVYDFIMASDKNNLLNKQIAECLYSGVMTDTGSFKFSSTTANVHRMVATLMEQGIVPNIIHENLFDNFLENRLRFMGHVLTNCMQVYYEYNTVVISIKNSDLVKYQIQTGDTEGLVNLPQSIKGIKLVAIIIDRYEEIKMSFRSKGDFDTNTFARKYFNGGGHYNASGGGSKKTLEEVNADFIVAMKESAHLLQ
jgi:bifunctional oligoribonuclease and PAP phosphatase NrnA